MPEIRLKIADILFMNNVKYRIIYASTEKVVLCMMNIEKFYLEEADFKALFLGVKDGSIMLIEDDENNVVNTNALSESEKASFLQKLDIVNAVSRDYGPTYLGLNGRAKKEKLDEILQAHSYSRKHFWKFFREYLQSGLKETALLNNKNKNRQFLIGSQKRGPKDAFGISAGCAIDERVIEAFEYGLKYYTSGRAKSIHSAYDNMNDKFFRRTRVVDGVVSNPLIPMDERPTERQFRYYCSKHVTKEELDAIKTSKMEQRNNKRLLLGEAVNGVEGPGERVEVDSLEVDNSLISVVDGITSQTVGRPIVYAMRDTLTHAVVAFSVGFENNSYLGITNLFLNLGDDKTEYCRKYGVELKDPRLWPSNILPVELYADRGPDYKSDAMEKLCNKLNIRRHLVPGGTGSLKGMIEQWFHQIHSRINGYTEGSGLIEKRHDSNHHKEAVLNIFEFTKMLIFCVLAYNQSHMNEYRPRANEIKDNVDATPSILWEYYSRIKGSPRPIHDRMAYLFSLMTDYQGKINKQGIHVHRLTYVNYNDKSLLHKMYITQKKKVPISIKYDPRDNSRIFYFDDDNRLAVADLNTNIGWQKDLYGLTFMETKNYFAEVMRRNKLAKQRNDEIGADQASLFETIIDTAKAAHPTYSETSNMREARERERQALNKSDTITQRVDGEEKKREIEQKPEEIERKETEETVSEQKAVEVLTDDEYNNLVAHFYEDY